MNEADKQPFDDTSWEDSLETHAAHILAFLATYENYSWCQIFVIFCLIYSNIYK